MHARIYGKYLHDEALCKSFYISLWINAKQNIRSICSLCIAFSSEVDPCVEGRQECGQNSQCVVDGDSFR